MSRNDKSETKKKSRFGGGLLPVIAVLIVIPIVLQQVDFKPENVKVAGRVCAGAAVLLLLISLVRNMVKIFALTLIALIVIMILASEGIIDVPRIFAR